jgi:hypothetical protein
VLNTSTVFPTYFDSRLDEIIDYIRYNNIWGYEEFLLLKDLKPLPKPSKLKRIIGKINPFSDFKRK